MELKYNGKNVYREGVSAEEINLFCEGYKAFLDKGKTERQCAALAEKEFEALGFKRYTGEKMIPGEKYYYIYKNKVVAAIAAGRRGIEEGISLIAAHIDSPRLDLKPNPVYEDSDICMIKTHYYGGVKKYQWTTVPLMLTGVIVKGNGEKIEVSIGGRDEDPVFYISDLLPHLASSQMDRKLKDGIKGEELNVIAGTVPYISDGEEIQKPVKENILHILNEMYGIIEEDLLTAELTFVPALRARDTGFDRSMVAAYGQDDKVCAYTSMKALEDIENPEKTCICIWADKEEIGSMGVTGMQSDFLVNFLGRMAESENVSLYDVLDNSVCLSADVDAAFDPTYRQVYDQNNSARLGGGIILTKYTGARGKSGTSDAACETAARVRKIFNDNGVVWQIGELGKVDEGGGGTVAQFIANRGIDTIDCGVGVISMHAPYEVTAKSDVYMAYRGYRAFFEAE